MATVAFYIMGAILSLFMGLISIPLAGIDALFDLPGLTYVWRTFVWFCSLFGESGDTFISYVRVVLTAFTLLVPIWGIRKVWYAIKASSPACHELQGSNLKYPF